MPMTCSPPTASTRGGRSWTYLFQEPFPDVQSYRAWLTQVAQADDPLFHAIIDSRTGKAVGVATLHAHRSGPRRDRGR